MPVRRLLYVGKKRTTKTLLRFFFEFGKERTALLKFICSDMWSPYLKVIRKKAPQALNILDRFHIVGQHETKQHIKPLASISHLAKWWQEHRQEFSESEETEQEPSAEF